MTTIEHLDRELHDLEGEFAAEKEAEEKFRKEVLARLPTKAKAAAYDLLLRTVRVFVFAWVAAFVPLVSGLGAFPNWDTWKSAGWSALVAAMAAVLKIVQATGTKGSQPLPKIGI